jgi:hypothetical protein
MRVDNFKIFEARKREDNFSDEFIRLFPDLVAKVNQGFRYCIQRGLKFYFDVYSDKDGKKYPEVSFTGSAGWITFFVLPSTGGKKTDLDISDDSINKLKDSISDFFLLNGISYSYMDGYYENRNLKRDPILYLGELIGSKIDYLRDRQYDNEDREELVAKYKDLDIYKRIINAGFINSSPPARSKKGSIRFTHPLLKERSWGNPNKETSFQMSVNGPIRYQGSSDRVSIVRPGQPLTNLDAYKNNLEEFADIAVYKILAVNGFDRMEINSFMKKNPSDFLEKFISELAENMPDKFFEKYDLMDDESKKKMRNVFGGDKKFEEKFDDHLLLKRARSRII